jgi:hypothetical protein
MVVVGRMGQAPRRSDSVVVQVGLLRREEKE